MSERNVLAACIASREAYESIANHIGKEDFSDQGRIILSQVQEYYQRDPDTGGCDPDLLLTAIHRELPNPKHQEMFTDLVGTITRADISPAPCPTMSHRDAVLG